MIPLKNPLEFERPLLELVIQLEKLRNEVASGDLTKRSDFVKVEDRVVKLRGETYGKLSPYQRVQLSRHFDRPFALEFVANMTTDFVEFHGDRLRRDDPAIVGGTASLGQFKVMIVGHQRGRSTNERLERNFGMANPEGYRKALRLFHMAEKFRLPVITLIDTQGAFPGLEAEENGQAEAIARNLAELAELTVPVVSVVIGEGGSGGALALGVADRLLMLENACYSVITPEGCASILWHGNRDEPPAQQAAQAAEMLKLTAKDLKSFGIIDEIVSEPEGGAHWNHVEAAEILKASLIRHLEGLAQISVKELLDARYQKFRKMGSVEN